jgi:hypothetical protein
MTAIVLVRCRGAVGDPLALLGRHERALRHHLICDLGVFELHRRRHGHTSQSPQDQRQADGDPCDRGRILKSGDRHGLSLHAEWRIPFEAASMGASGDRNRPKAIEQRLR